MYFFIVISLMMAANLAYAGEVQITSPRGTNNSLEQRIEQQQRMIATLSETVLGFQVQLNELKKEVREIRQTQMNMPTIERRAVAPAIPSAQLASSPHRIVSPRSSGAVLPSYLASPRPSITAGSPGAVVRNVSPYSSSAVYHNPSWASGFRHDGSGFLK